MVCDFCVQSVLKVFNEDGKTSNIDINLDTGIVTLTLKSDQSITDEEISKLIEYGGYDLDKIER